MLTRDKNQDVDELKQRLIETWPANQQSFVDQALDHWRHHLKPFVKYKTKHAEHLLSCVSVTGNLSLLKLSCTVVINRLAHIGLLRFTR